MSDDPRYPVGPFQSVGRPLSGAERDALIADIEAHPGHLRSAVGGLDDDQLDTPYREGGWTVRQVVHHVADSHLNAWVRFRLAVTEDHPHVTTYEQDRWAELPDSRGPIGTSLGILDGLHARWVDLLRGLPPEAFARTVDHPDFGAISVDTLLELYGWHGRHHEGHVRTLRERMGW